MSKIDGVMYRCDRCGEEVFMSNTDIERERELRFGIRKLIVGKDTLYLCRNCYLHFREWFDEGKPRTCEDTTAQEEEG